jgi:hypothetical protein
MNVTVVEGVTREKVVEFVKKVYELSKPLGLGFMHFTENPLSDEDAEGCFGLVDGDTYVSMDYVHGRSCKMRMTVDKNGIARINTPWYDHTNEQTSELLAVFGVKAPENEEHSHACECQECIDRR